MAESIDGEWREPLSEVIADNEPEVEESIEFQEDFTTFPSEWKEDFLGLSYIGALEKEVRPIPYHRFVIRTLLPTEKLEIALICKELEGTMGYGRAYRSAVVAAGIVSADGEPLPVFNKQINPVRERYQFIIETWYDPLIDALYNEIDALELRSATVVEELLKKKG